MRANINGSKPKSSNEGRSRKHSKSTKGSKLWEFIRDALKDPLTCPSIVRWEDPIEGVFRIVESEKLARLWGERKNNTKMTYEKLSRAMRYVHDRALGHSIISHGHSNALSLWRSHMKNKTVISLIIRRLQKLNYSALISCR
ncbi:unnamed protein product [Haemonchus placei]|uniref:ETS domain-containing protein n=1 Tax=Haemonchus placei TaxID=6290 RepID=A0A158QKE2_HAEPC|nr:unnamed protein product [Haemonchus placei]